MIVYKQWERPVDKKTPFGKVYLWEGWFLFGIIPLYIRRYSVLKRYP